MSVPLDPRARFEERIAAGVALYDVAHLLPRGRHRRATRRPGDGTIRAVFVHHSGALGRAGVQGAIDSTRYVVDQRDFPMAGYHLWLPRTGIRDDEGRLCALRLVPDETRAWSTGARANDVGVGWALQGHTGKQPISADQEELLEALIPWASQRYALPWDAMRSWLGWHSIGDRWGGRRKAACPGRDAERWLRGYLERALAVAA